MEAGIHQSPLWQSVVAELALFDEMQLVLADLLLAELLGRLIEVFGEPSDTRDVGMCGSLRVIAELEFLKHLFRSWVTGTSL